MTDLGFDVLAQAFKTPTVVIGQQEPFQAAHLVRRSHHLVEELIGLKLAQGLEHVVAGAHRPSRLHAREPLHGAPGQSGHQFGVTAHQRLIGQLGQFAGGEALGPCPRTARAVGAPLAALVVQREVQLEHRVEHPPVAVLLDQGGCQTELQGGAVLEGEVPQGLHGIDHLGGADRYARPSQFGHEAGEPVQ